MLTRVQPRAAAPTGPSPTLPRVGPSRRRLAWRHMLPAVRARFSIARLVKALTYANATSTCRQLAVVLSFPLPSVLASMAVPVVPLHDPTRGFNDNYSFLLLLLCTSLFTFVGTMLQVRAAAAVPEREYSTRDILAVAAASCVPFLGLAALVATYWRFPIPFFWVLFVAPWLLCLIAGNAVVLYGRFDRVGRPLLAYVPSLAMQVAQLIIYPLFSAVFEVADDTGRIVLILLFPMIKATLKKGIFLLTRRANRELSSEISVSSVEICSSMYQSIIMQTTPSLLATALLIGIDVLHGAVEIGRFVRQCPTLSRADIMGVLEDFQDEAHRPHVENSDLTIHASHAVLPAVVVNPHRQVLPFNVRKTSGSRNASDALRYKLRLTQVLELLQTAETILLVEYIEVAVPLVNAVFLAFATQFESAIYNPKLRVFYGHAHLLGPAIANLVLYTGLQALTLVAMAAALQVRLRLSALAVLAFVLESHFWSLQGKLVAWLSVFFVFSIVHNGVDFTFRFQFSKMPPEDTL